MTEEIVHKNKKQGKLAALKGSQLPFLVVKIREMLI